MGAAVGISTVKQWVTSPVDVSTTGVVVVIGLGVAVIFGSSVLCMTGVVWSVIRISSEDSSEDWLSEDSLDSDDSSDRSDPEDESSWCENLYGHQNLFCHPCFQRFQSLLVLAASKCRRRPICGWNFKWKISDTHSVIIDSLLLYNIHLLCHLHLLHNQCFLHAALNKAGGLNYHWLYLSWAQLWRWQINTMSKHKRSGRPATSTLGLSRM